MRQDLFLYGYSCFNRFERHLKENNIPFSFEAVDQWLDEVTSNLKDIEVNFYRTPMRRLKDVFDGEIKSRHFSPKRLITYPLCQRYKDLLERFLSFLSKIIVDCSEFYRFPQAPSGAFVNRSEPRFRTSWDFLAVLDCRKQVAKVKKGTSLD